MWKGHATISGMVYGLTELARRVNQINSIPKSPLFKDETMQLQPYIINIADKEV